MKSKSQMKREKIQSEPSWNNCHECQIKRGGKVPKGGFMGITVTMGTCSICKKEKVTLIPERDYNWKNKKAVFD